MTFRTLWHQARLYPRLGDRAKVRFWLLVFAITLYDEGLKDSFPHKITIPIRKITEVR